MEEARPELLENRRTYENPSGKAGLPQVGIGLYKVTGHKHTESDHQMPAFKSWFCILSNLSGPQCSHL